ACEADEVRAAGDETEELVAVPLYEEAQRVPRFGVVHPVHAQGARVALSLHAVGEGPRQASLMHDAQRLRRYVSVACCSGVRVLGSEELWCQGDEADDGEHPQAHDGQLVLAETPPGHLPGRRNVYRGSLIEGGNRHYSVVDGRSSRGFD